MSRIRVIFSDTKEGVVSYFRELQIKRDHVSLTDVVTDIDERIAYCKTGIIYFETVDRVEITKNGDVVVPMFEKKTRRRLQQ